VFIALCLIESEYSGFGIILAERSNGIMCPAEPFHKEPTVSSGGGACSTKVFRLIRADGSSGMVCSARVFSFFVSSSGCGLMFCCFTFDSWSIF